MGRLLITIFVGIFFINTFLSCKESKSHFFNSFIRLKSVDTVIRAKYEDTSVYNIKAADTTIKPLGFFFNVLRCQVYFDPQMVIPFCDSIIKAAKSDTTRWESQNFSIINSMTDLKNFAHLQKAETESVDWITMLLDRFNPLVIDTATKEKIQWILKEQYRSKTEGHTEYSALTNGGDTLFIGYVQDFMTYSPEK